MLFDAIAFAAAVLMLPDVVMSLEWLLLPLLMLLWSLTTAAGADHSPGSFQVSKWCEKAAGNRQVPGADLMFTLIHRMAVACLCFALVAPCMNF